MDHARWKNSGPRPFGIRTSSKNGRAIQKARNGRGSQERGWRRCSRPEVGAKSAVLLRSVVSVEQRALPECPAGSSGCAPQEGQGGCQRSPATQGGAKGGRTEAKASVSRRESRAKPALRRFRRGAASAGARDSLRRASPSRPESDEPRLPARWRAAPPLVRSNQRQTIIQVALGFICRAIQPTLGSRDNSMAAAALAQQLSSYTRLTQPDHRTNFVLVSPAGDGLHGVVSGGWSFGHLSS